MKLNVDKAEILGLLCAEGTHYSYVSNYLGYDKKCKKYYKMRKFVESIDFCNNNFVILNHFQKLLEKVYNYKLKIHGSIDKCKINIRKNAIIKDLLSFTDFGVLKWNVPKEIENGNLEKTKAFIRGYFDGDGSIDFSTGYPRIRLSSNNREQLKRLTKLFKKFDIISRMESYRNKSGSIGYSLAISDINSVLNFINHIGSNHPKKKERFENILTARIA